LSGDVTRSFRLHDIKHFADMPSTITVVKKLAEMSVENDASAGVDD